MDISGEHQSELEHDFTKTRLSKDGLALETKTEHQITVDPVMVPLPPQMDVVIHVKKSDKPTSGKDGHSTIHKVLNSVGMRDGLIR
jgi:hypothetical protein